MHRVVVTGQYRINREKWQALKLQDCHPKKLNIFNGEGYLYNLSLDLWIVELTASPLEVYYISTFSDGYSFEITEEGNSSINITASSIYFGLLDNGTGQVGQIAGWYKIVTSDRIPIPRHNIINWEVLVILPALILGYLRRKIKEPLKWKRS